jgi:restriction endonuclease Mrr
VTIPKFDQMLRPILVLAARGPITRRATTDAMAKHFGLSAAEQEDRLPSGASTVVANRVGWAMTFLTKGGLIEKVATKTYQATSTGLRFLESHASTITAKDLRTIEGWEEINLRPSLNISFSKYSLRWDTEDRVRMLPIILEEAGMRALMAGSIKTRSGSIRS